MKAILDTNVFLSCIGRKSPWRNVFDAFLDGRFTLCLSTEIVLEYEEKFAQYWGPAVADNLLGTVLTAANTSLHDLYFSFSLVTNDPDDNKFADTYVASGADYLISNDAALLRLNASPFLRLKS